MASASNRSVHLESSVETIDPRDDSMMAVDTNEEEWHRMHDIVFTNGQILEYIGLGLTILDVGFAQARHPLNTTFHYFEIQIVDPGENCYIAIGLTQKDYPKNRHPGWDKGSIAYHADDGKIFIGSGVGEEFGPRCHKGDILGCGISFRNDPLYFNDDMASEGSVNWSDESPSSSDNESNDVTNGEPKSRPVEVFFTRNGSIIGVRRVEMPSSGFYPSIGMLSTNEKVRVDLRPLTG
ncbi:SPRY domain containing 3 [Nesidiocoris tenuis]|uniref:SPRY domain containing 3 n=2 Tax=Nesidiocoris tenuis TaxID=355587 RepID=A0ABN7AED8_9HEMI|nr:SPRY domain containing 3 [Nesidiocoris tenuis]